MFKTRENKCNFRIREGRFTDAYAFAESLLTRKDVTDATAKETLLIFEALMQKLIDWGLDENTELEISGKDSLGDFRIKIEFEGILFDPDNYSGGTIEDRLLEAHDDKLDFHYHLGCNTITISVSRSNHTSMFACAIAVLCAVAVYLPISFLVDAQGRMDLLENYVFPLETLYTNAALMVGAPMTFFSLLKNLTDTYVVAQRNTGLRQLQAKTIGTSVFSILLAFVAFFIISNVFTNLGGAASEFDSYYNRSFADVITSFMPPSIFEPFEAISPIPLMAVALLCTYALCSAGKYFEALRQAMMACYTLFSRMLHVVIAALPFFCFIAFTDVLLDAGFEGLFAAIEFILCLALGTLLLFATYVIRLRARGVKVIPFARKLGPLIRENLRIGSAIDAARYNIRFLTKTFKMSREMLERNLPVLAEINLDGNCFLIMLFTLMFVFATGGSLPWYSLAGLAALTLFLSFGAPNQPGSILIGTLIIITYLNAPGLLCTTIYLEAFLGSMQNLINVAGDVVMVTIEDSKEKAHAENA